MDDKKNIPTEERVLPQQEVLSKLKTIRETRGLTLEDIFKSTRVGVANLTAVENGDYNRLPPPVYARNFIRKYALAIDVDAKPILERYERHLASLKPMLEETEVQKPWPETGRRYRFLFISLAAVIAAGVLVSAIFLYDQGGKSRSSLSVAEPPASEPVIPVSVRAADAPNVPAQIKASEPASSPALARVPEGKSILPSAGAGKIYHLVIEARELTWIRITVDQNPSYQVLLKPGDKIERMASDYFLLDIGNAGGIDLTFQGKSLGRIGNQGQIVHMRLPEKGSKKESS